jgi:hypothetical protein
MARAGQIVAVHHGDQIQYGIVTAATEIDLKDENDRVIDTVDGVDVLILGSAPTYSGIQVFGSVDDLEAVPDEDKGKKNLRPGVAAVLLEEKAPAEPEPEPEPAPAPAPVEPTPVTPAPATPAEPIL